MKVTATISRSSWTAFARVHVVAQELARYCTNLPDCPMNDAATSSVPAIADGQAEKDEPGTTAGAMATAVPAASPIARERRWASNFGPDADRAA